MLTGIIPKSYYDIELVMIFYGKGVAKTYQHTIPEKKSLPFPNPILQKMSLPHFYPPPQKKIHTSELTLFRQFSSIKIAKNQSGFLKLSEKKS